MKLRILAIFLLMASLPAGAQISIRYTGDPLPDRTKARIEVMMDYMGSFYRNFGGLGVNEIELMAFKEKKAGYRYMRGIYPDDEKYIENPSDKAIGGGLGGVYIPKFSRAVILGMEKGPDAALSMIYHEISHHFTRLIFEKRIAPVWLNEGLAEYFEHLKVKGDKITGGAFPDFQKGKIRTLAMLGELELQKFLDLPQPEFYKINRQDGQYYYGLSYAVVTVMMEKLGMSEMAVLVTRISKRNKSDRISDIVGQCYPGGTDGLEKDLMQFVGN